MDQGTAEAVPAEPVGFVQHEAAGGEGREGGKAKSKVRVRKQGGQGQEHSRGFLAEWKREGAWQ